jgi:hypothetical protein
MGEFTFPTYSAKLLGNRLMTVGRISKRVSDEEPLGSPAEVHLYLLSGVEAYENAVCVSLGLFYLRDNSFMRRE